MRKLPIFGLTSQPPCRQRGAVLFVALVLLIVLALLGVAGMQVTGLQERMSSSYRASNLAFQNAELQIRDQERVIQNTVDSGTAFVADQETCAPTFDPVTWAESVVGGITPIRVTRRLDQCFPGASQKMGVKLNELTNQYYQITAFDRDLTANATSQAVIDSIFIP